MEQERQYSRVEFTLFIKRVIMDYWKKVRGGGRLCS